MNFTVNKNDIIDVLSKIQGLTGRKSSLAITEAVLIVASGGGITITATDLETGFEGIYPASIKTEGAVAINAKRLYEIVRDFPVDEIYVNEVENNWIEIGNENVKYNIVGMNSSDFPDSPNIGKVDFLKIDSGDFTYKVESTKPIVAGSCAPLFGKYYEVVEVSTKGVLAITFDLSKGCK